MSENPVKKQSFLQGAAILALGTILVKLMGFLFKTPLQMIITEAGFGYFNTAYDVYNVLLMISTTGLPVAMSRMISQAQALGNHAQIRKIYTSSRLVFLIIGIAGSLGMLLLCRPLSVMVTTNENSWAAIAALSPCVLLICMISAYRGFFQGQSNMTPTTVSQIIEALLRLTVGLGAAWLVMKLTGEAAVREQHITLAAGESALRYGDITLGAGAGILGVTAGCFVSAVYLHSRFRRAGRALDTSLGEALSTRRTIKLLLAIAIPITLGSAGLQIINLFDTMIYMRRLTGALAWTAKAADTAKGVYGYCQTIFALPCSLITPITISSIPAITAALTLGNTTEARATEESAIRTMALIAMPCAAGLFVLAGPIVRLLTAYGESSLAMATPVLTVLGATVIFNSTVLLFNAILQAHGNVTTPVINMLIGGLVKIAVNYVLVAVPELNITGAAIGTLVCYIVITLLDVLALRRCLAEKPRILPNLARPLLASVLMGAATYLVHGLVSKVITSARLSCLIALAFAVVSYVVLALALRCVRYEDCLLLPKGEKIAKILRIRENS